MLVATLRDNDRLCPSRNSDMRRFLVVFAVVFCDLVNGRLERGFLLLETCWAQRRYGLLLVVGIDDLNDVDFSLVVDLPTAAKHRLRGGKFAGGPADPGFVVASEECGADDFFVVHGSRLSLKTVKGE